MAEPRPAWARPASETADKKGGSQLRVCVWGVWGGCGGGGPADERAPLYCPPECRVHAVLHRQPDGLHPQQHQPLEQRLAEACPGGRLVQNHGAQLAVVPYQDQLQGGSRGLDRVERGSGVGE